MERHQPRPSPQPARLTRRGESYGPWTGSLLPISRHKLAFTLQYQQKHVHARTVDRDKLARLQAREHRLDVRTAREHDRVEPLRFERNCLTVRAEQHGHESSLGLRGWYGSDLSHRSVPARPNVRSIRFEWLSDEPNGPQSTALPWIARFDRINEPLLYRVDRLSDLAPQDQVASVIEFQTVKDNA